MNDEELDALLANASPQGAALGGTVCWYPQRPHPCTSLPEEIISLMRGGVIDVYGRLIYTSLDDAMDALRAAVAEYKQERDTKGQPT